MPREDGLINEHWFIVACLDPPDLEAAFVHAHLFIHSFIHLRTHSILQYANESMNERPIIQTRERTNAPPMLKLFERGSDVSFICPPLNGLLHQFTHSSIRSFIATLHSNLSIPRTSNVSVWHGFLPSFIRGMKTPLRRANDGWYLSFFLCLASGWPVAVWLALACMLHHVPSTLLFSFSRKVCCGRPER